jgi:hypothetical protein
MASNLNPDTLENSLFIGKVVDNDDPEREGRCRVMVYGLFEIENPVFGPDNKPTGQTIKSEVPVETIPWAQPGGRKFFAGGDDGGFGDISIPKIGTFVQVKFIEGDIYAPEYYNIQNFNSTAQAEIANSYLNSHIWGYDVDEQVKLFYTPSKGMTIFHKDSQIIINPDSSITIEHAGGDSIIELVGSTINIVATSDVNITAPKAVVDANSIELGAGAFEAVIKGTSFRDFFNLHTHPAPNTPPSVQMPSALLSKTTKTK